MTKQALPRFVADVRLVIEVSGMDEDEAEARLEAIRDFITDRLDRTTFARLAGKPEVIHSDISSEVCAA